MTESPKDDWMPLFCFVESVRHPVTCVEKIYLQAKKLEIQSKRGRRLNRIRKTYESIQGTEINGWTLPALRTNWERLLRSLIEDIADNTDNRMLIMLDEFPTMISNILDQEGADLAMKFLDVLRELRQEYEPTDQIRFLLSGSIGLHLVVEDLKLNHNYKNNPTNNMDKKILSGMTREDVRSMCRCYLDEENIHRPNPGDFENRMSVATDGLPIFIQFVCERFQNERKQNVDADDIDRELRKMMDDPEIEWFDDAAERIKNYYNKLKMRDLAYLILNQLSYITDFLSETDIIRHIETQLPVENDEMVKRALDLLRKDNYLIRDTSTGQRRWRFRYELMRNWWQINRG